MSLTGKTIVITRDVNQAKPLVQRLENLGATILLFPTIKITVPDNLDRIQKILEDLSVFEWIIFTSINTVRYFFKIINVKPGNLQKIKIACVGKKTAETLAEYNLTTTVIPDIYTSHDLLKALLKYGVKGKHILLPASNLAGRELEEGLKAQGAQVERIEVYKNVPFENPQNDLIFEKIDKNEIDCLTFFSPSAMKSFAHLMGEKGISLINFRNIPIAVIGSTTARAARENGLQPAIMPLMSGEESFVEELEKYFGE